MNRSLAVRSALLLGVLLASLAWAASALAHTITSARLDCSGLTLTYTAFPSSPTTITENWSTGQTVLAPTKGSSGTVTTPLPSVPPNGTKVTVSGHRTDATDGTFSVSAVLSCNETPPPPPPPTCTPPAVLQNGQCVTPPPPPPPAPPTCTPPATLQNGQCVTPPPTTPPPPPVPPTPPPHHKKHHHHKHHPKPHVVKVTLGLTYFNQDPPPFQTMVAGRFDSKAPFGCRIVGPPSSVQHGLVHFRVRCRSARVLPGWKWAVDGRAVSNEHWTYTSDRGRTLNSWLFDRLVWTRPAIYGHYSITATGKVRV